MALVEGQKDGFLGGQFGTEPDLILVYGHVGGAAPGPEEALLRVAVGHVLLDGVLHRLLGEVVLELAG